MVVGANVCELTDGFLWFVYGLYVGILTSPSTHIQIFHSQGWLPKRETTVHGI